MRVDRGEIQMRSNKVPKILMQIWISQQIFPDLKSRWIESLFELAMQLTHDLARCVWPPAFLARPIPCSPVITPPHFST